MRAQSIARHSSICFTPSFITRRVDKPDGQGHPASARLVELEGTPPPNKRLHLMTC
jgi:hypothetical protein